jgi:hypothetical protein
MDFLGSWQGLLWSLYLLLTGWVVGWLQTREPLIRKVKALESVIQMDSAQKMERVLALESMFRLESEKVQELESDLKFAQAKVMALELDLERVQSKYWWKE